jgi:hypothetical protein
MFSGSGRKPFGDSPRVNHESACAKAGTALLSPASEAARQPKSPYLRANFSQLQRSDSVPGNSGDTSAPDSGEAAVAVGTREPGPDTASAKTVAVMPRTNPV